MSNHDELLAQEICLTTDVQAQTVLDELTPAAVPRRMFLSGGITLNDLVYTIVEALDDNQDALEAVIIALDEAVADYDFTKRLRDFFSRVIEEVDAADAEWAARNLPPRDRSVYSAPSSDQRDD